MMLTIARTRLKLAITTYFDFIAAAKNSLFQVPVRLPYFDLQRSIFSILVIAVHTLIVMSFHLNQTTFDQFTSYFTIHWLLSGSIFVDMFFVVSGYLISFQLYQERTHYGHIKIFNFYRRRFMRLLPVYYFLMLINYILNNLYLSSFYGFSNDKLWTNFLYINNYFPVKEQFMPWTWSLAVEEQFYLICPLFLQYFLSKGESKTIRILFYLLILAFFISYRVVFQHPEIDPFYFVGLNEEKFFAFSDTFYTPTHMRFGSLICGVMGGILHHKLKSQLLSLTQNFKIILSIAFLSCAVTYLTLGKDFLNKVYFLASFRYIFSFCYTGFLILLSQSQFSSLTWINHRIFFICSQLSYSAYIFHFTVILLMLPALSTLRIPLDIPWVFFFACSLIISLSYLGAYFLYLTIEKPIYFLLTSRCKMFEFCYNNQLRSR